MRRLLHVVGARPNFVKAAAVHSACAARGLQQKIVHTGQHYDQLMSDLLFRDLGLPTPDANLGIGSGTHTEQTARVMSALEPILSAERPDWLVVYGDVNSTMAAALVGARLQVPVAHVEAGLRSFDRSMPEEINRLVTDQLASLLLTPSADADENLVREGIARERIHCVGNVMIDTLVRALPAVSKRPPRPKPYALVTLHRPSNVDDPAALGRIIDALGRLSQLVPIVFPVHPRTRRQLAEQAVPSKVEFVDPLGYLDFVALERNATLVITDSGGVQKETTYLQVPCLTLRANTERPITVQQGTNVLVGADPVQLEPQVKRILAGGQARGAIPPLWDGRSAQRIAELLDADSRDAGRAVRIPT
jgi:UDP-N-acetylglucosamine 2-epimerase (non-hydrolysing)